MTTQYVSAADKHEHCEGNCIEEKSIVDRYGSSCFSISQGRIRNGSFGSLLKIGGRLLLLLPFYFRAQAILLRA